MAKAFTIFMDCRPKQRITLPQSAVLESDCHLHDGFVNSKHNLVIDAQNGLYDVWLRCKNSTGDYTISTLPYHKGLSITSAVAILASVVDAEISSSASSMSSAAVIDCLIEAFKKDSFLSGDAAVIPCANLMDISFLDAGVSAETTLCIRQSVEDLCYERTMSADSEMGIDAQVLGIGIASPFGQAENGIWVGVTLTADHPEKLIVATVRSDINSDVTVISEKYIVCEAPTEIASYIEESIVRYRLLSDMDGQTISTYDDMDLNTLDFIIT